MSAQIKPETSTALTEAEIEPLAHRLADAYWRALKAEAYGGQQTNVIKKGKKKGSKARDAVAPGARRIQAVK